MFQQTPLIGRFGGGGGGPGLPDTIVLSPSGGDDAPQFRAAVLAVQAGLASNVLCRKGAWQILSSWHLPLQTDSTWTWEPGSTIYTNIAANTNISYPYTATIVGDVALFDATGAPITWGAALAAPPLSTVGVAAVGSRQLTLTGLGTLVPGSSIRVFAPGTGNTTVFLSTAYDIEAIAGAVVTLDRPLRYAVPAAQGVVQIARTRRVQVDFNWAKMTFGPAMAAQRAMTMALARAVHVKNALVSDAGGTIPGIACAGFDNGCFDCTYTGIRTDFAVVQAAAALAFETDEQCKMSDVLFDSASAAIQSDSSLDCEVADAKFGPTVYPSTLGGGGQGPSGLGFKLTRVTVPLDSVAQPSAVLLTGPQFDVKVSGSTLIGKTNTSGLAVDASYIGNAVAVENSTITGLYGIRNYVANTGLHVTDLGGNTLSGPNGAVSEYVYFDTKRVALGLGAVASLKGLKHWWPFDSDFVDQMAGKLFRHIGGVALRGPGTPGFTADGIAGSLAWSDIDIGSSEEWTLLARLGCANTGDLRAIGVTDPKSATGVYLEQFATNTLSILQDGIARSSLFAGHANNAEFIVQLSKSLDVGGAPTYTGFVSGGLTATVAGAIATPFSRIQVGASTQAAAPYYGNGAWGSVLQKDILFFAGPVDAATLTAVVNYLGVRNA